MPQDMGGLPPGADVEFQRPGYGNERGLFSVHSIHTASSRYSLSEEPARQAQSEILRLNEINEEKR